MKCPFCGLDNTRVIDSRPADDNSSIRRRRLCDEWEKIYYIRTSRDYASHCHKKR